MSSLTAILAICTLFFLMVNSSSAALIPAPDADSHAYKVAVAHFPLTDVTYKDPYAATQNRKLMVSLFLPIPNTACVQECENTYMPPTTARLLSTQFFSNSSSILKTTTYTTCCRATHPIDASAFPLVVLEPQVHTTRLLYSTLARHLSAAGAAVVVIDHPYDASVVEFAFSRTIFNNGSVGLDAFNPVQAWNASVSGAVETRMRDVRFVLEQVADLGVLRRQFAGFEVQKAVRAERYVVVGHGLGGATATALSVLDSRVAFSVNMAGSAPLLGNPVDASRYEFLCTLVFACCAGWWLDRPLRSVRKVCILSKPANTPQYVFFLLENSSQTIDASFLLPLEVSPTDPPLQSTSSAIVTSAAKTTPTGRRPGPSSPAKQQSGIWPRTRCSPSPICPCSPTSRIAVVRTLGLSTACRSRVPRIFTPSFVSSWRI